LKTLIKKSFIQIVYSILQHITKPAKISSDSILIIAPHPDDEIIGTGGLLLQKISAGCNVNIAFLTDGECSGASTDMEETKQARICLSEKIARQIGIPQENLHRLHLSDAKVPHRGEPGFTDAVEKLAGLIDRINPSAVFATHFLDYWPFDHVACSQIATEAVIKSNKKPEFWLYWVWAWYFFRPWKFHKLNFKNLYHLDITNEITQKRELMDIYLQPRSSVGRPWSGVLPEAMIFPFTKPVEIVERFYY
jgi:LmbE family N-acetylglucosaminyl deacetylase